MRKNTIFFAFICSCNALIASGSFAGITCEFNHEVEANEVRRLSGTTYRVQGDNFDETLALRTSNAGWLPIGKVQRISTSKFTTYVYSGETDAYVLSVRNFNGHATLLAHRGYRQVAAFGECWLL